MAFGKIM